MQDNENVKGTDELPVSESAEAQSDIGEAESEAPNTEKTPSSDASSFDSESFESYEAPYQRNHTGSGTQGGTPPYHGYYPGQPDGFSGAQNFPYMQFVDPNQNPKVKKLKIAGWITFGLTFFAVFMSLIFAAFDLPIGTLICAAVPASCFVIGIILKRNKASHKVFLNVGFICMIMCALFLLVSVGTVLEDDIDDETANEIIESTESTLGIDLPEYDSASYSYYYSANGEEVVSALYYISEAEAVEMSKLINSDSRFIKNLPNQYLGLLPEGSRDNSHVGVIIYNKTLNTYNSLPSANGKYKMLSVALYYDGYDYYFTVTEYELDYIATFDSSI